LRAFTWGWKVAFNPPGDGTLIPCAMPDRGNAQRID